MSLLGFLNDIKEKVNSYETFKNTTINSVVSMTESNVLFDSNGYSKTVTFIKDPTKFAFIEIKVYTTNQVDKFIVPGKNFKATVNGNYATTSHLFRVGTNNLYLSYIFTSNTTATFSFTAAPNPGVYVGIAGYGRLEEQ